jgi:hypothetical protein
MSSEIGLIVMPTPCWRRKAVSGAPLGEVRFGIAGVVSPGHAYQGTFREPRRAPCLSTYLGSGAAQPKDTWSPGGEGCPREKRMTLKRSLLRPRETGGAGTGGRAVLRVHSTDEGGEPQGSRKGRPRYPLEGRDEQVDVSAQCHRHETVNSRRPVKWS